ncbi:MAG: DUF4268 domain-containing protein [Candidatus Poribacteria bacterium]|nr:DUF4268 domain-containing protein [Candidatus Poribacteria bacterium]
MTEFPNQEGLNRAFNIYRAAMRKFIISRLRQIPGTNVESVVTNSLGYRRANEVKRVLTHSDRNIESAIDINDFPHLVHKNWSEAFEIQLNDDKTFRNQLWLIVECRNADWAHPPEGDAESEGTRAHLFLIADVLSKINESDAKRVKEIREQLFSDEAEEHIPDVSEQLEIARAENAEFEKPLKGKSEIQERRKKFWKNLCDYAAQKDTPVRFHKPGSENYLNVSRNLIDLTGFKMQVWLGTDNREIAVRLYMSHQNFYLLGKQREEIDKEFGEPLEWEELPQRKESRVSLHKDITNPIDEADWQNQHKWIVSKIEKFREKFNAVFLPRLQEPIKVAVAGKTVAEERLSDISNRFEEAEGQQPIQSTLPSNLTPDEKTVFDVIEAPSSHIDTIIRATQLPISRVSSLLLMLELKGIVQQLPGKQFAKANQ